MRPWVLVKRGEVFRVDDALTLHSGKREREVSVSGQICSTRASWLSAWLADPKEYILNISYSK